MTWRPLRGKGGAAAWRSEVQYVSRAYSHGEETQESRKQAGRSTGRQGGSKHKTARQTRQSEARWNTEVLATQAN